MKKNNPALDALHRAVAKGVAEHGAIVAKTEKTVAYGYDGYGYSVGDRVELHPGCDLWMRGAKYGVVIGMSITEKDRVRVRLDAMPNRIFGAPQERFRRID